MSGSFRTNDTTLFYSHGGERLGCGDWDKYPHYQLWRDTLSFLSSIGFYVAKDKNIEKNYKILSPYRRWGRYEALEFKTCRYPAGFEINFYQNIVFENRHGGEYDFDKYSKMPYLTKKRHDLTIKKLADFLERNGARNDIKPRHIYAEDAIKQKYIEDWHHPQIEDFSISDIHGDTPQESYNNTDRDKKTLHNGEIKYFRSWDGRLRRGTVYHNINNMWWVILDKYNYTNIAAFNLFDLKDSDILGRVKKHQPPKEYTDRKKQLEKPQLKS